MNNKYKVHNIIIPDIEYYMCYRCGYLVEPSLIEGERNDIAYCSKYQNKMFYQAQYYPYTTSGVVPECEADKDVKIDLYNFNMFYPQKDIYE